MHFDTAYHHKRVLVTGHTGFKGSWLSAWLLRLGAEVTGISIDVPTDPSHFEALGLRDRLDHRIGDVRDRDYIEAVFEEKRPDIVFHLAAQPLVRESYRNPRETFDTNIMGTVTVLDAIRRSGSVKAGVMITSDKCYENVGWEWGYRENDRLGGSDPYSASKACAELVISSYVRSFFSDTDGPLISSARAGNVIGGGDWAADRIVPDCVRAWSEGETVEIRSPAATRPWQHVLEPLGGYLLLGRQLLSGHNQFHGQAYNFGPRTDVVLPVGELVSRLFKELGTGSWTDVSGDADQAPEARLLQLAIDKAREHLGWRPALTAEQTIDATAAWYRAFYEDRVDVWNMTQSQIEWYTQAIESRPRMSVG